MWRCSASGSIGRSSTGSSRAQQPLPPPPPPIDGSLLSTVTEPGPQPSGIGGKNCALSGQLFDDDEEDEDDEVPVVVPEFADGLSLLFVTTIVCGSCGT